MTTGLRSAAALLLSLSAVTPALGQEPAVLTDPRDNGAARPGPGIELGFYDPATRRFTPGAAGLGRHAVTGQRHFQRPPRFPLR